MAVYPFFQASQKHGATEVSGKTLGQEQMGVNSLLYRPFILGCIQEEHFHQVKGGDPTQHWQGHIWNAISSSVIPSTRGTWT